MPGFAAAPCTAGSTTVERRRRGLRRAPRRVCAEVVARRSPTARASIVLSDRDAGRRARADPVAAADRRGAPPPRPREDPHPGRPGRRDRRRPRGAPLRAAARLRRRRGQPVPRVRDDRATSPRRGELARRHARARRSRNLIKALGKGVLKVMSKMGISTVASYTGAQIFEAVGLATSVVDEYFTGTASRLGGVGLDVIAEEVAARHAAAYPRGGTEHGPPRAGRRRRVPVAARGRVPPVQPRDGLQAAARDAQRPLRRLQGVHRAASTTSRERLRDAARAVRLQDAEASSRPPVPIDEVEPVARS